MTSASQALRISASTFALLNSRPISLEKLKTQHVVDAQLQEVQTETIDGKRRERLRRFTSCLPATMLAGSRTPSISCSTTWSCMAWTQLPYAVLYLAPNLTPSRDSLPFFESKLLQRAEPALDNYRFSNTLSLWRRRTPWYARSTSQTR